MNCHLTDNLSGVGTPGCKKKNVRWACDPKSEYMSFCLLFFPFLSRSNWSQYIHYIVIDNSKDVITMVSRSSWESSWSTKHLQIHVVCPPGGCNFGSSLHFTGGHLALLASGPVAPFGYSPDPWTSSSPWEEDLDDRLASDPCWFMNILPSGNLT